MRIFASQILYQRTASPLQRVQTSDSRILELRRPAVFRSIDVRSYRMRSTL